MAAARRLRSATDEKASAPETHQPPTKSIVASQIIDIVVIVENNRGSPNLRDSGSNCWYRGSRERKGCDDETASAPNAKSYA
jgi:hypothetical protein